MKFKIQYLVLSLIILVAFILSLIPVKALELNPFADSKTHYPTSDGISDYLKSDFNSKYGVIVINKNFMWVNTGKVAEYSLTSNTEQCLINCYSYGKVVLYDDGKLFENTIYKDKKGSEINISTRYYIKIYENYEVEVPVYKKECGMVTIPNGTYEKCENKIIEYKKETRVKEYWKEYKDEILKAGNYEWKIEGTKGLNQVVDFIPVKSSLELDDWAWWNANWGLRKPLYLTNATINYSYPFEIDKEADMNADWSDLRFANSSNKELDYWIENQSSVHARVWVQMDNNDTIYMYYKNPAAASTSNFNTTFIFADDFGGNTLNPKWDCTGLTCTITTGYLQLSGSSGETSVMLRDENLTDYYAQIRSYSDVGATAQQGMLIRSVYNASKEYTAYRSYVISDRNNAAPNGIWKNIDGTYTSVATDANDNFAAQTWYTTNAWAVGNIINTTAYTSNTTFFRSKQGTNGDLTSGYTGVFQNVAVNAVNYDYFFLTNWINPTPTYTLGAAEEVTAITIINSYPLNNSNISSSTINFGCNSTTTGNINITGIELNVTGDAIWKQNIVGLNTENYNATFTNSTILDGSYTWKCISYGDLGDNATSSLWNFTKDATLPNVSVSAPTGSQFVVGSVYNITLTSNASDVHLQRCYYNTSFSATVNSFACNTTQTILNVPTGSQSVYVYANDSFGNVNMVSSTWDIASFINSVNFDANVNSGSSSNYSLNMTYNATLYPNSNIFLNYNGTNYGTIQSNDGINQIFSSTLTVPTVSTPTNYTLFFAIQLINNTGSSVYFNSTSYLQQVFPIKIDDCSVFGNVLLNYTMRDEKTQDLINATLLNGSIEVDLQLKSPITGSVIAQFNRTYNYSNNALVCLEKSLQTTTTYSLYAQAKYLADGYATRNYYIQNMKITNTSWNQAIPLFDILLSQGTLFTITYKDSTFVPLEGALITIQRQYPGENKFKSIDTIITDERGTATSYLDVNGIVYTFIVSQDGIIVSTFNNTAIVCQSIGQCVIGLYGATTEISGEDFTITNGVSYNSTVNINTGLVTLIYQTIDASVINATMNVVLLDQYENKTLCTNQLISASGTLFCTVPSQYNNNTMYIRLLKNGQEISREYFTLTANIKSYFNNNAFVLLLVLFLTLPLLFLGNLLLFGIGMILGLIIASTLLFMTGSWLQVGSALGYILFAIILVWWRFNQKRET